MAYGVTFLLIFWIVAPLLVTVWGSFTTLTAMGTASEGGPPDGAARRSWPPSPTAGVRQGR